MAGKGDACENAVKAPEHKGGLTINDVIKACDTTPGHSDKAEKPLTAVEQNKVKEASATVEHALASADVEKFGSTLRSLSPRQTEALVQQVNKDMSKFGIRLDYSKSGMDAQDPKSPTMDVYMDKKLAGGATETINAYMKPNLGSGLKFADFTQGTKVIAPAHGEAEFGHFETERNQRHLSSGQVAFEEFKKRIEGK